MEQTLSPMSLSLRYPDYTSPHCIPRTLELDDDSQVMGEYSDTLA